MLDSMFENPPVPSVAGQSVSGLRSGRRTHYERTSPARRERFLAALRLGVTFAAAARSASDSPYGAQSTFRELSRRDPNFALQTAVARAVGAERGAPH